LTSYGKPLTQFEIAGADKVFRPATANIRNGTIVLSSPWVPTPVAVRYAFKDFVVAELFSTEGYPVSSFRTDDWQPLSPKGELRSMSLICLELYYRLCIR